MCLETRFPLSQLPRDGDRRAHLNTSASLLAITPALPSRQRGSTQGTTVAFCCPREWACVSPSGRHLCLQERTAWGCREGQQTGGLTVRSLGSSRAELATVLVFLSLPASILCLICLLFFALMVHGVHMLFDLFENIEVYENTKGLLFLKYRCSFTHIGLHPDKPIVS